MFSINRFVIKRHSMKYNNHCNLGECQLDMATTAQNLLIGNQCYKITNSISKIGEYIICFTLTWLIFYSIQKNYLE